MAANTTNFGLVKPSQNEAYNIDVFNGNSDIIDTELKTLSNGVAEAKKLASDGKVLIAAAITQQGVTTAATMTFAEMAANIMAIITGSGNALAEHVLYPFTFTNATGIEQTGKMPNNGAVSVSLNAGGTYTVVKGYHDGTGKVVAASLSAQTAATALATYILAGYTAWVNGVKITGTIPSKGAATYTPSTSAQSISAGQYLSGVQTIAAIPSNYININTQQMVFSYGSYGAIQNLGAYYARSNWATIYTTNPAIINSNGSIYLTGTSWASDSANNTDRIVFRKVIPQSLKYVQVTWNMGTNTTSMRVYVLNPSTKASLGYVADSTAVSAVRTMKGDLSSYVSTLTNGWALGIYMSENSGGNGIFEIKLSPTAFT